MVQMYKLVLTFALVRPMNNTVEEARNDGRKVAIHTGTKRSRANNIFRNDQTDLYWLCVDTFKLGKITDENSEGGYSIQGKDSAGNPLALLSAGVNGKCYRLSVPEHFPLTFDKTGKVDTLRAPRYDYETDTWQKDGKSRSTSLMFFADEEDMDNLLGTAVRLFQRRVNGRFTDEAKIDTAGNVKVEGAEGSAEEVVADTEKDNVANRDEPEETENQEPEKETPEEEEVL